MITLIRYIDSQRNLLMKNLNNKELKNYLNIVILLLN